MLPIVRVGCTRPEPLVLAQRLRMHAEHPRGDADEDRDPDRHVHQSCADPNIGLDTARVKSAVVCWPRMPASMFAAVRLRHHRACWSRSKVCSSADNAMVLAVLVLGLPEARSSRRRCATASSARSRSARSRRCWRVYLIQLGWVKLVGAGYLLYLVYRHFGGGGDGEDRRTPPQGAAVAGADARSGRRS